MKDKCVLTIHLDATSKPFYTASDIVSGYVRVVVLSKIHVTDLDLALQCEEKASVALNKQDVKKANYKKVKSVQSKLRHYLSVQHPLHTEKGEEPLLLEKGEYTYPFTFHLSEDINSAPPHAPIYRSKGLYAGVWWSIVATFHRPRLTQTAYKASIDVPIQPLPRTLDSMDHLNKERATVGGFSVVQDKPNFIGLLKGERATANLFEAQLSYPMLGIPQHPQKPGFGLVLRCEQLAIQVASIEASMLQQCRAQVKQEEYTFVKEYPMGVAKLSQSLGSNTIDVSHHLEQFALPEVLVAPFASKLIRVTYHLRLAVSFVPLISNTKGKARTLTIETPVVLQSPVVDWAKSQLTNMKPVPRAHFSDTFSDPGARLHGSLLSGSNGPRSVGDATAITDATTGTTSSYLSYEIQRPGQVISNVMHWFGKSNDL